MISYSKYFSLMIGLVLSLTLSAQDFKSKPVPSLLNFYNASAVKSYNSVDLDLVLRKSNNIATTTRLIQQYVDEHAEIILPDRSITISEKGLSIGNNKTLIFQKNSRLKIEPNKLAYYGIINVINAKNVTIRNANLVGDRYEHKSNAGEWGMGIRILGGEKVVVDNFTIKDCWGDGIYVGRIDRNYSKNVVIMNGIVNNNRRNGISVTSVDGLKMSNVISSNTNGTAPEIGIDFEVNDHRDQMTNISINNITTFNNNGNGLVFSISKMLRQKDVTKNVNVDITNYTDYYSPKVGLLIAGVRDNFGLLSGKINLNNLEFNYNLKPFIIKTIDSKRFQVNVGEYVFKNTLNKNFTRNEFKRVNGGKQNVILK